jgi:hypothetical protein
LRNTEGPIKNGQSRETGSMGYTGGRKTKQKHNTMNAPLYEKENKIYEN